MAVQCSDLGQATSLKATVFSPVKWGRRKSTSWFCRLYSLKEIHVTQHIVSRPQLLGGTLRNFCRWGSPFWRRTLSFREDGDWPWVGGHFSQLPPASSSQAALSGLRWGLGAQGLLPSLLKQVLSHTHPYTLWSKSSVRLFSSSFLLLLGSDYFHLVAAARVESLKTKQNKQNPFLPNTQAPNLEGC